jgi:hypothetical protein
VPPETHFFDEFYGGLMRRRRFPLDQGDVRSELLEYASLKTSEGLELDADKVLDLLQGICNSPGELYGAITRALAGDAQIVGEKTPDHLRWWFPISRAFPSIRVVAVTRDPRGVVASRITAGWGARIPELLATRWLLDQEELQRAASALPLNRFMRIRYEDAAAEPNKVRALLASFLGTGSADQPKGDLAGRGRLFLPWEYWKERAAQPITTDRIFAWEVVLDESTAGRVIRVCRREMIRLGYPISAAPLASQRVAYALMSPNLRLKTLRMKLSRIRQRRWIERQRLD